MGATIGQLGVIIALWLGSASLASAAAPPVPSKPTTTCDATIGSQCYVNGPFTLSSYSAGAHHYQVCRSNNTTSWGGCNVVMTSNSGSSYTVSGSHLPSEGYRRAYRFRACDAAGECTAWAANTALLCHPRYAAAAASLGAHYVVRRDDRRRMLRERFVHHLVVIGGGTSLPHLPQQQYGQLGWLQCRDVQQLGLELHGQR